MPSVFTDAQSRAERRVREPKHYLPMLCVFAQSRFTPPRRRRAVYAADIVCAAPTMPIATNMRLCALFLRAPRLRRRASASRAMTCADAERRRAERAELADTPIAVCRDAACACVIFPLSIAIRCLFAHANGSSVIDYRRSPIYISDACLQHVCRRLFTCCLIQNAAQPYATAAVRHAARAADVRRCRHVCGAAVAAKKRLPSRASSVRIRYY